MDYIEFFGIETEPFVNTHADRFFFNSVEHSNALVKLMYAIQSMKGLALCMGDVGSGKTTLARRLLNSLNEEEFESALIIIIHSALTSEWFLKKIAMQLGVKDPEDEKVTLMGRIFDRLCEFQEKGKKTVVLIDEAHMIKDKEVLEEIKGILNLETSEGRLLTFIIFGLPEIEDILKIEPSLAQRVGVRYLLKSFSDTSTKEYIEHRLKVSGCKENPLSEESIKRVHHYSTGIPRLINTICDNALFEAFLLKEKSIHPELIDSVAIELGFDVEEVTIDEIKDDDEGKPPQPPQDELFPQEDKEEEEQDFDFNISSIDDEFDLSPSSYFFPEKDII